MCSANLPCVKVLQILSKTFAESCKNSFDCQNQLVNCQLDVISFRSNIILSKATVTMSVAIAKRCVVCFYFVFYLVQYLPLQVPKCFDPDDL